MSIESEQWQCSTCAKYESDRAKFVRLTQLSKQGKSTAVTHALVGDPAIYAFVVRDVGTATPPAVPVNNSNTEMGSGIL